MFQTINWLKQINKGIATVMGIALLCCIVLILLEIILRTIGIPFASSSEEISGYLMAILSSWGIGYALVYRSHIRIDILRNMVNVKFQSLLDLISSASVAFVAIYIALRVFPVIEKSMKTNSLSNTALEIPLVIPQTIWFAGWVWFAISSSVLLVVGLILFIKGKQSELHDVIGTKEDV